MFTGPIQVGEMVWVILRRESLDPAVKGVSLKDEQVRKQTYEMIYEVKLKETMGAVMQELIKAAAIENQLTGTVKLANEEKHPEYGVDGDVKLMSNPPAGKPAPQAATVRQAATPRGKNAAPPVGLVRGGGPGIREDQAPDRSPSSAAPSTMTQRAARPLRSN